MPPPTPAPLEGAYFEALRDDIRAVLVVRRTSHKARDFAEVREAFTRLDELIDRERLQSYGLMLDLRAAPISLDSEHGKMQGELFGRLCCRFGASAVLTRTAAGKLQVMRGARAQGLDVLVTTDEAEALVYLRRRSRS